MLFAPLLAAAAIPIVHTGFEGAQLERVEPVTPTHFRALLRSDVDQDGRNRQANWYYFRIDGARGHEITVDLTNLLGEYNYRANRGAVTKDIVPVWSGDNVHWRHFTATDFHDEPQPFLRLTLKPTRDRVWIAHVPLYTNEHLARLERDVRRSPYSTIESAGRTPQGRAMPLWTFTDTAAPADAKRGVWLMFRQHAWETGSSWAGEGAVRFLISNHPDAARIRRACIFKIFPMADPDGLARGNVRFNAAGFDLDRNWDVDNAVTMPEISAQKRSILAWLDAGRRLDLFLSLHNTETSEYLEAPPAGHDELGPRVFCRFVPVLYVRPHARVIPRRCNHHRRQARPHDCVAGSLSRAQFTHVHHGADDRQEPEAGRLTQVGAPHRLRSGLSTRRRGRGPAISVNLPVQSCIRCQFAGKLTA
ncbi:MAG: hypothetical protein FJW31_02925 [Acidobacteria bacterium]|nr:hypothetical protein [Acidobacteriota bacterium]